MPRFFVSKNHIIDGNVTINGDDAHHIARSLRMAQGEHITVCDMQGMEYECELCSFEGDRQVVARVLSQAPVNSEPPVNIVLYQGLPKGDKLDTIIQKAVECGASRIVPFESEYCIARVRPDAEKHKTERRNRIALEAAKQCGRGILPTVESTLTFSRMIEQASQADIIIFCYEGEGTLSLKTLLRQAIENIQLSEHKRLTISLIIGSEGGFSEKEACVAKQAGGLLAGLGSRILRTETASCFVLGCLAYEFEL